MRGRSFGYYEVESFLHRMDALTKLVWVLLAATLPFVLTRWWELAAHLAALATLSLALSRHEPHLLVRPWLLFVALASLLAFFHLLTRHDGEEVARVGVLVIHDDGVRIGAVYGLRVLSVMAASYVFVRTTSPRALVVAAVKLGVPYRYAWMLFVALLSIPIFEAEFAVVREAQLVRGLRPGGRLRQRADLASRYTRSLLISGLRRVENLSIAMDARAFGAYPQRTFTDGFRWSAGGLALALAWAAAFAAAVWLRLQ